MLIRKLKIGGGGRFKTRYVPATAALVLTAFAPSVAASNPQTVTPPTRALTLTTYAPTVTGPSPELVVPGTATLTLTEFTPTVSFSLHRLVTPATASLTLTTYIPVVGGDTAVVVPSAALILTRYSPTITAPAPQTVTPTTRALTLTTYAPSVNSPNHLVVTPTTRALATARFAPTVTPTVNQLLTPATKALTITRYVPTVTAAAGGSYYIAPGGNNTTGSGTIGSPWRTIGKFLTVAAPGDTLYCRGGTYQGADIGNWIVTVAGTASQRIVIRNYPGEVPAFTGEGSTPRTYLLNFRDGSRFVTVHGLKFVNWWSDTSGIITSAGNAAGSNAPHDLIWENCVGNMSTLTENEHGFYVGDFVYNVTIRGNELVGYGVGAGFELYHPPGPMYNIDVYNNLFRNWPSQAVQIWDPNSYNIKVHGNTFVNNLINIDAHYGATGIEVYDNCGTTGTGIYNPNFIVDVQDHNYWGLTLTGPDYAATGPAVGGARNGGNAGWTRPAAD